MTMLMKKINLQSLIDEYVPQINNFLVSKLKTAGSEATLIDSMSYSVMAGGKRLRPLLCICTFLALHQKIDSDKIQLASAIELLHTYSLIHDDLPAMDNDDLRRGKPTNHKKYGEAMAILAGDGLQALAFDWMATTHFSNEVKINAIKQFAEAVGPKGMVSGQSRDIVSTGKKISLPELKKLHSEKTGALINFAIKVAGIVSNANEDIVSLLNEFGNYYGLAFQIYDDILDVTKTSAELGKTANKDLVEGKNTYPTLLGMKETQVELKKVLSKLDDVLNQLSLLDVNTDYLAAFIDYFK